MKTKSASNINRTEIYEAYLKHYTKVCKMSRVKAATRAMEKALRAFTPSLEELELDARIATMHEAIFRSNAVRAIAKELGVPVIKLEVGKACNLRVGQAEREGLEAFKAEECQLLLEEVHARR
jgi:hypothetical protein